MLDLPRCKLCLWVQMVANVRAVSVRLEKLDCLTEDSLIKLHTTNVNAMMILLLFQKRAVFCNFTQF